MWFIRDIQWVKKNTQKMSLLMTSLAVILSIGGLASAKWILKIWLGPTFVFSYSSLFWLCIMQILLSFISPYFMVLNALGKVKIQLYLFLLYTPICFILKYYLSIKYGITMIPMIGAIFYLLIIVIGSYIVAKKNLNKLLVQSTRN